MTDPTTDTLTATVQIVTIGTRSLTMTAYRQLDWQAPEDIVAFGRVNDPRDPKEVGDMLMVYVIGRSVYDGSLVRSSRSHATIDATILSITAGVSVEHGRDREAGDPVLADGFEVHDVGSRYAFAEITVDGHPVVLKWHYQRRTASEDLAPAEWHFVSDEARARVTDAARRSLVENAAFEEWAMLPPILLAGLRSR